MVQATPKMVAVCATCQRDHPDDEAPQLSAYLSITVLVRLERDQDGNLKIAPHCDEHDYNGDVICDIDSAEFSKLWTQEAECPECGAVIALENVDTFEERM